MSITESKIVKSDKWTEEEAVNWKKYLRSQSQKRTKIIRSITNISYFSIRFPTTSFIYILIQFVAYNFNSQRTILEKKRNERRIESGRRKNENNWPLQRLAWHRLQICWSGDSESIHLLTCKTPVERKEAGLVTILEKWFERLWCYDD